MLADILDGGTIVGLINISAMVLVLGGTMGATVMSTPMVVLRSLPSLFGKVLRPKTTSIDSTIDDIAALATRMLALPPAPEHLAPLALAVPTQLLAEAVSRARGLNPDSPRGLSKVTQTI